MDGDRFTACFTAATKVMDGKVKRAREIQDDHFSTISYYFDRAVDYGLIGE